MSGNTRRDGMAFVCEGSTALKPRQLAHLRLVEGGTASRLHGATAAGVRPARPRPRKGAPNVACCVSPSQTLAVYAAALLIGTIVFGSWLIQQMLL